MTLPTLALILKRAAGEACLDPAQVRGMRPVPEARNVQLVYCWLAVEMTQRSLPAIGLLLDLPAVCVRQWHADLEQQRLGDPAVAGYLQDLQLEITAESGVNERLRLRGEPDRDPQSVAERILAGRFLALTVSVNDLTALALGYRALERRLTSLAEADPKGPPSPLAPHVAAFLRAEDQLAKDRMTPFERGALRERTRALDVLRSIVTAEDYAVA